MLQRKVNEFSFTIKYAEGKTHLIADALSRALVFDAPEAEVFVNFTLASQLTFDPYLHSICDAAAGDLQDLLKEPWLYSHLRTVSTLVPHEKGD